MTDNLTGLMWTKDAQQISGTMIWIDAVSACNNLIFAGYHGWRLPNVRELQSLIDYGNSSLALPDDHPFTSVQSHGYWSSFTVENVTTYARSVGIQDGAVRAHHKDSNPDYVWPVRAGN